MGTPGRPRGARYPDTGNRQPKEDKTPCASSQVGPWPPSLPTSAQFLSLLLPGPHRVLDSFKRSWKDQQTPELGLKIINLLSSGPPPPLTSTACSSHGLPRSLTLPLPAQAPPRIHSCFLESLPLLPQPRSSLLHR